MRIGFVGAGKVGFTLGRYIREHDAHVSGYYSRSEESAAAAAEFTNSKLYKTLEELVSESDAIFLTVPDGVIGSVWEQLKNISKAVSLKGKSICHCSGALSTAVFSGIDQTGAFGYSIHPLFAINDRLHSYQDLSHSFFTIEGATQGLDNWTEFFEKMGNQVRIIKAQDKVLYHSAAVFSSNLVVGLFDMAADLLVSCGFDKQSAITALEPLFLYNSKNICSLGTEGALTGPVERNDLITVEKHLKVLEKNQGEVYRILSKKLVEIAKDKNSDKDYERLKEILNEEHSGNF